MSPLVVDGFVSESHNKVQLMYVISRMCRVLRAPGPCLLSGLSLHTEVLSRSQQRKEQLANCK